MGNSEYILEMRNIRKTFGELVANDNVNLKVRKGTVHSIIGENGAGKSTLMNILTDIHKADSGDILLNGEKVHFKNSLDAARRGIGMIYQEFMLYRDLSVFDNIILGFEKKKWGFIIDRKACRKEIERICSEYSFNIPLDAIVKDLSVAMLQQVEIVKVLYRGADIIIMDEPTSVLTPQGIQGLFRAIRNLVGMGKTIIFISHKLKEVLEISDYITIMNHGRVVAEVLPNEVDEAKLASLMVGRDVILQANKVEPKIGDVLLSVKGLTVKDKDEIVRVKNVDFEIHSGEILGIAGVAGSGQQWIVEALFGLRRPEHGSQIIFDGKDITYVSPREHRLDGIGYVPQDRMGSGVNAKSSLWENSIMGYHIAHGFKNKYLVDTKQANEFTDEIVEQFDVRRQANKDKVAALSGGNIQKMVVGREFLQRNKLLIIEDPTRGIDVGAIEFIWQKIIDLAQEGVAVLLISHELNEVMQLSDTIKVIYNGQLYDGGRHGELTEEEIGLIMLGGNADAK
ncbi:MAG: ABC transporter ATP-binding protein [Erysipelotrichaceae bacterium]|nr:ABC transporter ATP-binding protein [Erysipelotrichaceae bacterium]